MTDWRTNKHGQNAVEFLSRLTLIGDYLGQRWNLEPFQDQFVRQLFGTRDKDDRRVISCASFWAPRGTAKTQLGAGICLLQLVCGPPGQEIYAISADRDKAARTYQAIAAAVRADPALDADQGGVVTLSDYHLSAKIKAKGSVFRALANDQDVGHSLAPSTLILDEVHLFRTRTTYDAMITGMGKRRDGNRLEIHLSTAGTKDTLAWDLYQYARDVRDRKIDDPHTLPLIFEASPDDDWESEDTWMRAHPALGKFFSLEFLRKEHRLAKSIRSKERAFKQLFLSMWLEQEHDDTWLDIAEWRACEDEFTADDLHGESCYAHLDLSKVRDLTSLSLFFPETRRVLTYSWTPKEGLADRSKRDQADYYSWHKLGFLYLCDGKMVQYQEVGETTQEILRQFDVKKLTADPYALDLIIPHLGDLEPESYAQTPRYVSPPAKWLESAICNKAISFPVNPLLRWSAGNVVVKPDDQENIFPSKKKSRGRIDPVVALVCAIGAWLGTEGDCNTFFARDDWKINLND